MKTSVTVEFTHEEFTEVVDLLQLMTVLGVRLWVQGPQPNLKNLSSAFNNMTDTYLKKVMNSTTKRGDADDKARVQQGQE